MSRNGPAQSFPLQVGVLVTPTPTARRRYKLGKSLRKAILSYPEGLKVAIVATGGLSHQVHGERAGFNNTKWDLEFMDRLEKDPESLTNITAAEYARLGGWEGGEVIMWLVMRGAMSSKVRKLHQSYYLPSMTAIGTAIYEDDAAEQLDETAPAYMDRIHHETKGMETIEGTYPFTLDTSVRAYRLNRFLHDLIIPEHRRRFLADPEATFEEAGLTEKERTMVRNRDWREMIHYGVIFFRLEKLGAVVGT
jgi:gallate dioxygenase